MGEIKRKVLEFIPPIKFGALDRIQQWKLVNAKRDLATQLFPEKTVTTGSAVNDKILWRKLTRHVKYYEQLIRNQDQVKEQERWALIRANHPPCQQTLTHGLPLRLATGKWPKHRDK